MKLFGWLYGIMVMGMGMVMVMVMFMMMVMVMVMVIVMTCPLLIRLPMRDRFVKVLQVGFYVACLVSLLCLWREI